MRWNRRLHDDFMLPWFVWQDFRDVQELAEHGFPPDPAWFAPHIAFRFPRIGSVSVRGWSSSSGTRSSPGTCSARR